MIICDLLEFQDGLNRAEDLIFCYQHIVLFQENWVSINYNVGQHLIRFGQRDRLGFYR